MRRAKSIQIRGFHYGRTTILSTNYKKGKVTVQRKQKNGFKITVSCPLNIIYNQFVGVDFNDQLRKYNTIQLKSRKVYKYVFWFCLKLYL